MGSMILLPDSMDADLINRLSNVISRHPNGSSSEHVIHLDKLTNASFSGVGDVINSSKTSSKSTLEISIILVAYSILFIVSMTVNLLVCYIMYKNKRLRTVTNAFITNLSVSDIIITLLNIPFNIIRNIMDSWILGEFMCRCANFILMASVYVSTFTMAAIALDRYKVIMYPLRPRVSVAMGVVIVITTWVLGIVMSLPFVIFAQVTEVEMLLYTTRRCRMQYPQPSEDYERFITLGTFLCQYVLPILITAIMYSHIVYKLWSRETVGQSIETQQVSHLKSRRRSIKMLIIVVVMFSICWLPLNLYHILTDFHPDTELFQYNSRVFLSFHWLAVSSVCYNPLIYCWSKETFRAELRKSIMWLVQHRPCSGHSMEDSSDRSLTRNENQARSSSSGASKHDYSAVAPKSTTFKKRNGALQVMTPSRSNRSHKSEMIEIDPMLMGNEPSYFSSMGSKRTTSGVEPDSHVEHSWSGYSQFHQWV